ncbi:hypothetical protein K488DRAFT_91746, partial [Vararia minispora EC-137]
MADASFEQALRTPGTRVLRDSPDVDQLGVHDSPGPADDAPSFSSLDHPSRPRPSTQSPSSPPPTVPPLPTVVPPTPSPAQPARPPMPETPSTSTLASSADFLHDPHDAADYRAKRRSIYRSPGTASSPDLATL